MNLDAPINVNCALHFTFFVLGHQNRILGVSMDLGGGLLLAANTVPVLPFSSENIEPAEIISA